MMHIRRNEENQVENIPHFQPTTTEENQAENIPHFHPTTTEGNQGDSIFSQNDDSPEDGDAKTIPAFDSQPSPAEISPHSRSSIFDHSVTSTPPKTGSGILDSTKQGSNDYSNAGLYSGLFVGMMFISLMVKRQMQRSEKRDNSILCTKVSAGMKAASLNLDGNSTDSDDDSSLGEMA